MTGKQPLLLATRLRADWEQTQRKVSSSRHILRRAVQVAISVYALSAFVAHPVEAVQRWLPALQLAALGLIFTGFTFAFVRIQLRARLSAMSAPTGSCRLAAAELSGLSLFTLALAAVATLTMPADLRPTSMLGLPFVSPTLAVSIPITTGILVLFSLPPRSIAARLLGFAAELRPHEVLIGALVGGCLGAHFWITYAAWLPSRPPPSLTVQHLLWVLSFTLGFQALLEEVFFRGMLYRLYQNENGPRKIGDLAPIVLLNSFIYLLPGLVTMRAEFWPWRVGYGLAFAALATWLRDRQGSLTASYVANATFTVLFALRGVL